MGAAYLRHLFIQTFETYEARFYPLHGWNVMVVVVIRGGRGTGANFTGTETGVSAVDVWCFFSIIVPLVDSC